MIESIRSPQPWNPAAADLLGILAETFKFFTQRVLWQSRPADQQQERKGSDREEGM
jgi:hypothetical protein